MGRNPGARGSHTPGLKSLHRMQSFGADQAFHENGLPTGRKANV